MSKKPYNPSITEKINQRRRQILVHSCLYYQMDASYIEDATFDRWCRELVELQREHPDESKNVAYYEHFKDFEGSTGFDLPYNLPEIQRKAMQLLARRERIDVDS